MAQSLPFTGERVVPGATPIYLIWAHTARYQFVREGTRGKHVLDAGSGEGYGTYYLAQHSRSVTGVDISPEAVAQARRCYVQPNLAFSAMDVSRLACLDASFDVVCSFEVIEHLGDMDRFLSEVRRVLRPGGIFYVSTPNGGLHLLDGLNPYHEKELILAEYGALLRDHFTSVKIYGQFCQRPRREWLYTKSTQLFFQSRLYRRMIQRVAPLYFHGQPRQACNTDPHWVDKVNPGTFTFCADRVEQATYFMAVCCVD